MSSATTTESWPIAEMIDPAVLEQIPLIAPEGQIEHAADSDWQLFSGCDQRVRDGMKLNPELRMASWLIDNDDDCISDAKDLGHLLFPAEADYESALWSLYQCIAIAGRLPEPDTVRQLRTEFGVDVTWTAEFRKAPSPLRNPPIVCRRSSHGFELNLTAPFGWDPETGEIDAPTIGFPDVLSDEAIDLLIDYSEALNLIVPVLGSLETPILESTHFGLTTNED